MDLSKYSLEELLLASFKSEQDAEKIYRRLAEESRNMMLQDKIKFLAQEEVKHQAYFANEYKRIFPEREMVVPGESPVPLPGIVIPEGAYQLGDIFSQAIEAEEAACDFYTAFAEKYKKESYLYKFLLYIASMEKGHAKLLEIELDNIQAFEDRDFIWSMAHVGP